MLESDIHLISFLILLSNLLIMLQQTEIFPCGKNVDIFKDFFNGTTAKQSSNFMVNGQIRIIFKNLSS